MRSLPCLYAIFYTLMQIPGVNYESCLFVDGLKTGFTCVNQIQRKRSILCSAFVSKHTKTALDSRGFPCSYRLLTGFHILHGVLAQEEADTFYTVCLHKRKQTI